MRRLPITLAGIRAHHATAQKVDAYRLDDVEGVLCVCQSPRYRRPRLRPIGDKGPGNRPVGVPTSTRFKLGARLSASVLSVRRLILAVGTAALLGAVFSAVLAACLIASSPFDGGRAEDEADPVFGIKIPTGYRDWKLISVAHEEGKLDDLRAVLGNDIAIDAYREGKQTFPDGAIIARLAWAYTPSEENNKVFGQRQSYVTGPPKEGIQFMVKDSKKFASTGGWGFAQFNDGKPSDETALKACFPCHAPAKGQDFVYTHYAP